MKLQFKLLRAACLLIGITAMLIACQPSPSTPAGDETTGGDTGNAAQTGEAPDPAAPEGEELQPLAGLADRAYTATLIVSINATREGQPVQRTDTLVLTRTLEPPARALTVTTEGDTPESAYLLPWSAEIGGISYTQAADGQCAAALLPAEMQGSDIPELASLLPGVIGASEAGSETVNGVETTHYTFDQTALDNAGEGAAASGEAWVAADGALVRYTLTMEDPEGTVTYDYSLGEAQPVTIPASCPAGRIDITHMPDAQDVSEMPGSTTYTTPSEVAAVVAHYQEQLAGSGWEPVGEPLVSETDALMDYVQGDWQLSILASAGEDLTTVNLLIVPVLGEEPPPSEGSAPAPTPTP